MMIKACDCQGP